MIQDDDEAPPDTSASGSAGSQSHLPPKEAEAVIASAPTGSIGLRTVTTVDQLKELATSGEPAEVKRDIVAALLLGAHQANEAELRLRVQQLEKEVGRLRKQLAEAQQDCGDLRGDLKVERERVSTLRSHRSRDAFLTALSTMLFGLGCAFLGRSLPTTILGLGAGVLLFLFVWVIGPVPPESGK